MVVLTLALISVWDIADLARWLSHRGRPQPHGAVMVAELGILPLAMVDRWGLPHRALFRPVAGCVTNRMIKIVKTAQNVDEGHQQLVAWARKRLWTLMMK